MTYFHKQLRQKIEQYCPQTDDVWEDFSANWTAFQTEKNKFLIKEGQVETYFYFVVDGVQRAFVDRPNGEEVNVGFTYNGDFSGAFDSFISKEPTFFSIQAITSSRFLRIRQTDLERMFDQHKSIERWGRLFYAQILVDMGKRQVESRSYSAEERFDRLMTQSPHILQLVPQKHLASYLGMSPETFSRTRARYKSLS